MKKATKFAHIGRPKIGQSTSVNPPITRASTLLFDKAKDLYGGPHRAYGRHGSTVHDALAEVFCELENGAGCSLTPSGLSANTLAIQAFVKAGDHILVTDSTYGPVRYFCDKFLRKFGVEVEYYPPRIGGEIAKLIRPNTSCILLESPGSLTFEIQDLPAIAAAAKKAKVTTIVDNTWSAGLTYSPFELGADIIVHAATKYFGGHSDTFLGAVISRTKPMAEKVRLTRMALGSTVSPDDAYQVLRGFRTVVTRFKQQEETAHSLAKWLQGRDEVNRVLHPGFKSHPDYKLWKRDFSGAACLFGFALNPCTKAEVLKFVDRLKLFGKGFSYGGFESLAIHCDPQIVRNHQIQYGGPLIRLACGIEDVDDLRDDLENALKKIKFTRKET
jgi:cystathionine beta-lyase